MIAELVHVLLRGLFLLLVEDCAFKLNSTDSAHFGRMAGFLLPVWVG